MSFATLKADILRIESAAKRALSHISGTYAIASTALVVSVCALFKSCH